MNTNVKDRLRCAYEDCAEAHPLANESTYADAKFPLLSVAICIALKYLLTLKKSLGLDSNQQPSA